MIHVVDYGAGNIGSVLNMIKKVGGQAVASGSADDILKATKILLPGVGSFDNAVTRLNNLGLAEVLRLQARAGVPLFGICLGMQLLANTSDEGELEGLGLIPGRVRRFKFEGANAKLKTPHMGWNYATPTRSHKLTIGLEEKARFYFVHSYFFACDNPRDELFHSNYGGTFTSGVQRDNVMGVQFHPEKSHRFGMQLLKNFCEL